MQDSNIGKERSHCRYKRLGWLSSGEITWSGILILAFIFSDHFFNDKIFYCHFYIFMSPERG